MSALGQKQTYAVQNGMSALPPIATVKADIRKRSCLLDPRKQTCACYVRDDRFTPASRALGDVVVRKMQTRLMSSHGFRLAIGSLALCFANLAGAQESLERGKSAVQLYAANCAGCHKSPHSVTKATRISESFLREQYSPSSQS